MSKYYISDHPYFNDIEPLEDFWKFFIGFIQEEGDEIIIVDDVLEKELVITPEILKYSDFEKQKPKSVFVSQSPFMLRTNQMHLCRSYSLNDSIVDIISKDWLKEIQETGICSNFVIRSNGENIFMVPNSIIAKLHPPILDVFNSFGFEFKEWNVKLNEINL